MDKTQFGIWAGVAVGELLLSPVACPVQNPVPGLGQVGGGTTGQSSGVPVTRKRGISLD